MIHSQYEQNIRKLEEFAKKVHLTNTQCGELYQIARNFVELAGTAYAEARRTQLECGGYLDLYLNSADSALTDLSRLLMQKEDSAFRATSESPLASST